MNTIQFITPTVLDEAFLFVMGASVKKTDSPIGFFGTGLKYAIAVTLRLGGSIRIETRDALGRNEYSFTVYGETLRSKSMQMIECLKIVHANDTPMREVKARMPMTADYGKTWESWMALRELWSNTKDEDGYVIEGDKTTQLSISDDGELVKRELHSEYTRIVVKCDAISDAWQQRDKYFLNEHRKPIFENSQLAIYTGSSDTLFYRGIRVTKDNSYKSALTYNIKELHSGALSEDRTIDSYYVKAKVLSAIGQCGDAGLINAVLMGSLEENNIEHSLPYGAWSIGSDMDELYAREAVAFVKKHLDLAPTALKVQVFDHLDKTDADRLYTTCKISDEMQVRFDKCIALLKEKDIDFEHIKCRIVFSREVTGFAVCKLNANTIWLNPDKTLADDNYMRPTCETLIEEYVHMRWRVADETRDMQEKYNTMIYELIKFGEVQ